MLSSSAMRESLQTGLSRGRRSRNKVSVGEPAEGSFQQQSTHKTFYTAFVALLCTNTGGLALLSVVMFGLGLIRELDMAFFR